MWVLNGGQDEEIHKTKQTNPIAGLFRSSLRLWYRAGPGEPWTMLDAPLQHRNGEIIFASEHFTEFALFGLDGVRLTLPLISR